MKQEFFLVLPDIRSCHNVGSMIRTADAFGVTKIFLCGYTACPPKPQIDKVSLGAEKWVPLKYYKNPITCLKNLKKNGVKIIALEQTVNSKDITISKFKTPLALVMGNETEGVAKEILDLCDDAVHIKMYGRKESLNVSVAAGIAMFAIKEKLNLELNLES